VHPAQAADRPNVVFTADHGECAGAHGFNQKTVFHEESARAPLILAWKGKTSCCKPRPRPPGVFTRG
jgi:arylsulfatase A-like enzyme